MNGLGQESCRGHNRKGKRNIHKAQIKNGIMYELLQSDSTRGMHKSHVFFSKGGRREGNLYLTILEEDFTSSHPRHWKLHKLHNQTIEVSDILSTYG